MGLIKRLITMIHPKKSDPSSDLSGPMAQASDISKQFARSYHIRLDLQPSVDKRGLRESCLDFYAKKLILIIHSKRTIESIAVLIRELGQSAHREDDGRSLDHYSSALLLCNRALEVYQKDEFSNEESFYSNIERYLKERKLGD